ncbi:MAG: hypothetical protein J5808_05565 [Paludibacteraceae bacterium]|nr:hypothetical protein [Paludibacteraceae bacterium]
MKRILLITLSLLLAMSSCKNRTPEEALVKTTWDNFALNDKWEFEYINFSFCNETVVKATFLEYNSQNRYVTGTYKYDPALNQVTVILDGDSTVCSIHRKVMRYTSPDAVQYDLMKRSRFHKPDF